VGHLATDSPGTTPRNGSRTILSYMNVAETRFEVQPIEVVTATWRVSQCELAEAAPSGQERHRWAGGKPPSDHEREIVAARRARKRAA